MNRAVAFENHSVASSRHFLNRPVNFWFVPSKLRGGGSGVTVSRPGLPSKFGLSRQILLRPVTFWLGPVKFLARQPFFGDRGAWRHLDCVVSANMQDAWRLAGSARVCFCDQKAPLCAVIWCSEALAEFPWNCPGGLIGKKSRHHSDGVFGVAQHYKYSRRLTPKSTTQSDFI